MKIKGLFLIVLLLAGCTQPTATEPTPTAVSAAAPTATNTAVPPTATSQPTATPLPPTSTPAPATATPEPSPTVVAVDTFSSTVPIQDGLTLVSETAVIQRESANKYLNGGALIFHDGQFHMFANFFNAWPGATVTYHYISPDGQTWTRSQEEPLFTISDVPLDGRGALALSGLVQADGTWVLYYHTFSSSSQPGFIGRATATQPGGPWSFDTEPVLAPGRDGEWDELQVMRVNVLPHDDGYIMYYAGVNRQNESRIGMALSADGISWQKYDDPTTTAAPYAQSDPILEPQLAWEGSWLGRPEVVQSPDGWVLLYEGGSGSQSGIAISADGLHFERYEANPILTRENMVDGFTFFQGALIHQNDTYFYLIEAGNGRIGTDIYLYTFNGSLLGPQ